MKMFLLDDSDALGRYISKVQPAGSECKVFCVDSSYYGKRESLDDFLHAILNNNVWQLAGDAHGNEHHSLKSLMGNVSDECLFLIHVNLKPTKFSTRQDQEGIELLKHIRLTDKAELDDGRNTHVILYSFEDQLELLKRKPGNLIMLSEGVTFFRLPDGLNQMATPAELAKFADKRADVDRKDFKRFVQCDFQLPDAAHQFSNWWGVYKLSSVVPGSNRTTNTNKSDFKDKLRAQLLSACVREIDALVQKELRVLANKKALFLFGGSEQLGPSSPPIMPTEAPSQKLIILHLDDEPNWTTCLRWLINSHFVDVDYESLNKIPEHIDKEWVLTNVCKKSPSLILLDLRLRGPHEVGKPVKDTSGATLAKMIREETPGTPIILMTASNKAWVFEEMMKLGVDGYWMKEGVGEHLPPEGSVRNSERLLDIISTALSEHYQFLREFTDRIAQIKNSPSPWWEHYNKWPNRDNTKADPASVHRLLSGAFVLFRECLRLFCMGYAYTGGSSDIKTSWMSAPIMEMAKVIELVHNLEEEDKRPRETRKSLVTLLGDRRDGWGRLLNAQRRHAAHAQGGCITIEFKHVQSFISGVLTWMLVPPDKRRGPLESQKEYKMIHGSNTFHEIKVTA